jgi:hypothetical protein
MPTLDALNSLEARWEALGVDTGSLRAGLPETEVASTLASNGLLAHPDLLSWFSWHDGTSELYWYAVPTSLGPLSLAQALEHRESYQPQDAEDLPYNLAWLPILGGPSTDHIALDSATGELLRIDPWDAEAPVRRSGHTLDSAVPFFLTVLETVALDFSSGPAAVDFGSLPSALQTSALL